MKSIHHLVKEPPRNGVVLFMIKKRVDLTKEVGYSNGAGANVAADDRADF